LSTELAELLGADQPGVGELQTSMLFEVSDELGVT
jgi:hypothetical protein